MERATMNQNQPPLFQMPAQTDGSATLGDLRTGSTGASVTELQEVLAALGLYTGDLDGIYGEKTEAAVRTFQVNAGLSASGIVDAQTMAAIQAQIPPAGQQNATALGPSMAAANASTSTSAGASTQGLLQSLSARWAAMPLWEKALIITGVLAVGAFGLGLAKRGFSGLGNALSPGDVERELSMQRRKCRAILPTGGDWTAGETVDAVDVREVS